MRKLSLSRTLDGYSANQVFKKISDFKSFEQYTSAVRQVDIEQKTETSSICNWSVNFRDGVLCWREQDDFYEDKNLIEFVQLDGDMKSFSGSWVVKECEAGAILTFNAEFDLGIPSLAELLDPIAESALKESIDEIIDGVFPVIAQQSVG